MRHGGVEVECTMGGIAMQVNGHCGNGDMGRQQRDQDVAHHGKTTSPFAQLGKSMNPFTFMQVTS
jgi:hypothetical protein